MQILKLFWKTLTELKDDDPFQHSAGIAYYAIFSIPGLIAIVIWTAGSIFGQEAIQGHVSDTIQSFVGQASAESIEDILANARQSADSLWAKALASAALIFGATTLFLQLQKSLNAIWEVKAAPKNGILKLLSDRATSFGLIIAIAFLLLITLILSTLISLASEWIDRSLGTGWLVLMRMLNFFISLGITSTLFAAMFRFLPDVEIRWRSVWVGAIATAILFTIGKSLLGYYFGVSEPGSSYGAASSVILMMLWVNYTCLILFIGAKFSKVHAEHYGLPVQPSAHAEWTAAHQLAENEIEQNEVEQSAGD